MPRVLRLLSCLLTAVPAALLATATLKVHDEPIHALDPRVFGHFMERPSWHGEIGVEAALVPGTNRVRPGVVDLLRGLHAAVYRFPHGTDGDYVDWTDMVDGPPGRVGGRPVTVGHLGGRVTNRFGYDEFLRLCEELGSEALLVVNFRDGLLGKRPLDEAARHAAALVAYTNARADQLLPNGLGAWSRLRVRNGRIDPYRARYFQIGNETWSFEDELRRQFGEKADDRYLEALEAYVDAMRQVDPAIRIVVDGHRLGRNLLIRKRLGRKVDFLADHYYTGWEQKEVRRGIEVVPLDRVPARDVWYGWVSVPSFDASGQSVLHLPVVEDAGRHGYPIAVTEWNWNGWWTVSNPPLDSDLARALGSTAILHGLMRQGKSILIANQSMTIGRSWNLAAIRVDETSRRPDGYLPSGLAFGLYARHHGPALLRSEADNLTSFEQPLRLNAIQPARRVAHLDLLATGGRQAVFVHAINRHFDRPIPLRVDLSDFGDLAGRATHHLLTGGLDKPLDGPFSDARVHRRGLKLSGKTVTLEIPPRSISVVEVPRRGAGAPPAMAPAMSYRELKLRQDSGLERTRLKEGDLEFSLFVPRGWRPSRSIELIVHFHGSVDLMLQEHFDLGMKTPIAVLQIGSGSSVYRRPFEDRARFGRILACVAEELKRRGAPQEAEVVAVDVSSFSAGYGALRELVKTPSAFRLLRRVVLADSLYGSLAEGEPRRPLEDHVGVWLPLARAAMAGRKTFAITFSEVPTPDYASSSEVAEAVVRALGGELRPVGERHPAASDARFPLRTSWEFGRLSVWGYGGDDAPAHVTHLRNVPALWQSLGFE
jgi:alpha-L-arabinofuranosidase